MASASNPARAARLDALLGLPGAMRPGALRPGVTPERRDQKTQAHVGPVLAPTVKVAPRGSAYLGAQGAPEVEAGSVQQVQLQQSQQLPEKQQQGLLEADVVRYVEVMGRGDAGRALWKATRALDEPLVAALLRRGAPVNFANSEYYGYLPLHVASQLGHLSISRRLLDAGAAVDARGAGDETALHEAMHERHEALALLLLQRGAALNAVSRFGKTPLELAPEKGRALLEQRLLLMLAETRAHEAELGALRQALARSVADKALLGAEIGRWQQALETERARARELERTAEGARAEAERRERVAASLRDALDKRDAHWQHELRAQESETKLAHSRRREAEHKLGDAAFEARGLSEQVAALRAELAGLLAENERMDKYIASSVGAVARKNARRGEQRAKDSPRSIKLRTMELRVRAAEDLAFSEHEAKERAEAAEAQRRRELARSQQQLYMLRAPERRRTRCAERIQRAVRRWLARRAAAATRLQTQARRTLARRETAARRSDRERQLLANTECGSTACAAAIKTEAEALSAPRPEIPGADAPRLGTAAETPAEEQPLQNEHPLQEQPLQEQQQHEQHLQEQQQEQEQQLLWDAYQQQQLEWAAYQEQLRAWELQQALLQVQAEHEQHEQQHGPQRDEPHQSDSGSRTFVASERDVERQ
jgi:hypothetical protein